MHVTKPQTNQYLDQRSEPQSDYNTDAIFYNDVCAVIFILNKETQETVHLSLFTQRTVTVT